MQRGIKYVHKKKITIFINHLCSFFRIDSAIEEWTSKQPPTTVLATMETSKIPAGQILSVAEITSNPQYRARNMFEKITLGTTGKTMEIHAITPKLLSTPGSTVTGGPELGQHTAEVLSEVLGMSEEEIDELRQKGVI